MKRLYYCFFLLIAFQTAALAQTPKILINEFMASNKSTILDSTDMKYEDWIEIYNFGETTVDIGGMYITDTLGEPAKYQIPEGNDSTKIEPGKFLILWADNNSNDGILHIELQLNKMGEQLGIYMPDGVTPIDTLTFQPQTEDVSYGRITDGAENWKIFERPTPGTSNNSAAIEKVYAGSLDIYPNPATSHTTINLPEGDAKTIKVFNISGMLMSTINTRETEYKFNVSSLNKGFYFIVVYSENSYYTNKISVE